jgi:undecaprenyl-diphosphatase
MEQLALAILLGLIEGITELLPVSSSGHMIITTYLLGIDQNPQVKLLEVVSQLGAISAVLSLLWQEIKQTFVNTLQARSYHKAAKKLNAIHFVLGLLPATVAGLYFSDFIDQHLFSIHTATLGLAAGGLLMIVADQFNRNKKETPQLSQVTYQKSGFIGLMQCLSLWPGFSRLGSTVAAGVLSGLDYITAYYFSFLLALPIIAGATLLKLRSAWPEITLANLPFLLTGTLTAFIVAQLIARTVLKKILSQTTLRTFGIYRLTLALVINLLLLFM